MLAEVLYTVGVVDGAVGLHHVLGTHAVLHHHQRLAVTVVQLDQAVAQALGVDLPAPVGGGQIRVLDTQHGVARGTLCVRVHRLGHGHIVAAGNKVHTACLQGGGILGQHFHMDALALEHLEDQAGVLAPDMHIGIEQVFQILCLSSQLIIGCAGAGIGGELGQHAAHLAAGDDLVAVLYYHSAGHQLVVQGLIAGLQHLILGHAAGDDAGGGERVTDHAVHLVEGEPVLDLILVALKARMAELCKAVDHAAIHPAIVLGGQCQRHFVVAQRDQRLDAVLVHLSEQVAVELQALFVRLGFLAGGEDASPCNGNAQHGKAHLGKQLQVFFVMMVEVDAAALGIIGIIRVGHGGSNVCVVHGNMGLVILHVGVGLVGGNIGHAGAFAIHVPCALYLVRGNSAAPEKAFGETHLFASSFSSAAPGTTAPSATVLMVNSSALVTTMGVVTS